jgi:micrococcal nuclease
VPGLPRSRRARLTVIAVAVLFLVGLASRGALGDTSDEAATPDRTATSTTTERRSTPAERILPTTTSVLPSTTPPTTVPPAGLPAGDDTVVESITDGDTLRVPGGTRVRLIGIDTPESTIDHECFGAEASIHLKDLVPAGTPIRLVYDVELLDRYDRTLAYVYRVADGLFVNLQMVELGYAAQFTVPPNVAHADEFGRAATAARDAGLGLWSACGGTDTPVTPAPAPAPAPAPPPAAGPSSGNCDPAYPDLCIPVGSPDLDCKDVSARRFRVLPPDPHGFDGNDNDGLGCES